jgi:8-oxo-dGTP pyrophosphatase MutT (NUDIX family)
MEMTDAEKGDHKALIDEEEHDSLPLAVCVVIPHPKEDGKLLLVSRKDDPNSFGLPGGKVDPGETPLQAAIREVSEETDIQVELHPVPIYETVCLGHAPPPGGQDYYAFAYLAKRFTGIPRSVEAGVVKWGTWEDQFGGNFERYNQGVRRALLKQQMLHYSGYQSDGFWKKINQLPDEIRDQAYEMGCQLQELEARIMRILNENNH